MSSTTYPIGMGWIQVLDTLDTDLKLSWIRKVDQIRGRLILTILIKLKLRSNLIFHLWTRVGRVFNCVFYCLKHVSQFSFEVILKIPPASSDLGSSTEMSRLTHLSPFLSGSTIDTCFRLFAFAFPMTQLSQTFSFSEGLHSQNWC